MNEILALLLPPTATLTIDLPKSGKEITKSTRWEAHMSHTPLHERHIRCTASVFWLDYNWSTHWWVLLASTGGGWTPHLGFDQGSSSSTGLSVATWAMGRSRRKAPFVSTLKRTEKVECWWSSVLHFSGHGIGKSREKAFHFGPKSGREDKEERQCRGWEF